jgi:hypothetical protein
MKTPKPIKRSEHIVSISREHHATLLFCWKLRQGVKMEIAPLRMSQYVSWFWQHHILPHFNAEERLLFTDANEPMIKKALDEHEQIYKACCVAENQPSANAYDAFLELADLVDKHTRYEERELFPWIEQNFSEERLIRISKELDAEEHHSVENYKDEFWVKQP